jgi:hypothetical protein
MHKPVEGAHLVANNRGGYCDSKMEGKIPIRGRVAAGLKITK